MPKASNVAEFPGANRNKKPAAAPKAVRGIPEPASWVPKAGKDRWKAIAPELHRLHLLGVSLDQDFATAYADTYAKWEEAAKRVNEDGLFAKGQKGETRRHPAILLYFQLSSQLLALQTQAGLTPNSRLRMKAPEVDEDAEAESVLT